eukprot:9033454-Lingulodinium_polyedra.AAC.1
MSGMVQHVEEQIKETPKHSAGRPGYAEVATSSEGLDMMLKEREELNRYVEELKKNQRGIADRVLETEQGVGAL